MLTPRFSAWFGDPKTNNAFSGLKLDRMRWTPELLAIKSRIETIDRH